MAILPGTNSYVTLAEANGFLAGELGGERWDALNEAQKERCLITAARRLDALPLIGKKAGSDQLMAFPRSEAPNMPPMDMTPIKQVQIMEAFALSDNQAGKRRQLQEQGVKSISIEGASESYSDNTGKESLTSREALRLLRPWLLGSVRIV